MYGQICSSYLEIVLTEVISIENTLWYLIYMNLLNYLEILTYCVRIDKRQVQWFPTGVPRTMLSPKHCTENMSRGSVTEKRLKTTILVYISHI